VNLDFRFRMKIPIKPTVVPMEEKENKRGGEVSA
jgi:hypothetical protein